MTQSIKRQIKPEPSTHHIGIRGKLIAIFIVIKVIPLVLLAGIVLLCFQTLQEVSSRQLNEFAHDMQRTVAKVGDKAIAASVKALNQHSRELIERLSTDTANDVASFLYDRDIDILQAANSEISTESFKNFLSIRKRSVMHHGKWELNDDNSQWVDTSPPASSGKAITPQLNENRHEFHAYPQTPFKRTTLPLYLEITYIDLNGMEQIKVTSSEIMNSTLADISTPQNTWIHTETYFPALQKLQPGEIYVSNVIGAYVPSRIIGLYTPAAAKKHGIDFLPEEAAYAGIENPVGRRFQGIVRWATPVVQQGKITGYVTLALDHTHIMEFTDHIVLTDKRYSDISDASTGNYAFMWDNLGRNISHPRDQFIVGYDPQTGEQATPWLEQQLYSNWKNSNTSITEYLAQTPTFDNQSHDKKPSVELMAEGYVGLDCRYLNFAPQCNGWRNLTQDGGSGSFVIFWSKLWKLTTAATIPYYTGQYGNSKRGFGFVTVGANIDEFHQPALNSQAELNTIIQQQTERSELQRKKWEESIADSLIKTSRQILISTTVMIILVIAIALWMASYLTGRITRIVTGLHQFQSGDMTFRLSDDCDDEMGELNRSFNLMASEIGANFADIQNQSEQNKKLLRQLSHEIEERKNSEKAFTTLYQKSADGILILKDGIFIDCNEAVVQMLDYERKQEFLNTSPSSISPRFQPDGELSSEKARTMTAICLEKGRNRFEWVHSKAGGDNIWIEVVLTKLQMYGDTVIHTSWRDISKLKKFERERIQTQNLQSIGVLAGGIAHDFNNILTAIMGNLSILSVTLKSDPNAQELLKNAQKASIRAKRLTRQLLTFAKGGAPIRQTEQLADIITDSANFVLHGSNVDCIYQIPDDFWFAEVDRGQVSQVIQNLVLNAKNAMKDGGEIIITCRNIHHRDEDLLPLTPGTYVQVQIEDSGPGISEKVLPHIFDPYFSTTEFNSTKGNGLGLAIVHSVITKHKGFISVESKPGEGSCFTFYLPAKPEFKAPVNDCEETIHPKPLTGRRILVMDDEEMIRTLSRNMLKLSGLTTDTVKNGEEAIKFFQAAIKSGKPYDVVILDLTIPGGMGGEETSKNLLVLDPKVKIFVSSGYSSSPVVSNYWEYGFVGSIPKPFNLKELSDAVASVL